ncbi:MAG: dTDP-4-dehydrorhamnose reductase [Saprospiraceae bacterium]|nr:dTDP-4-dehydrorhamnose reductase [Saprospiraceae bacterium]
MAGIDGKKKILVTGANGQLGQEFTVTPHLANEEFIFWTKEQADISSPSIRQKILRLGPTHLINCAAYTAVDQAESESELANKVNAEAVGYLAGACTSLGIPMIHFSSDYVYHNNLRRPLFETDPTRPKGVYARSKLKGEQVFAMTHEFPFTIRVSWLYSTYSHNFPKTILRLAQQREHLNVVRDQIGAPTYARDLAQAVMTIIRQVPTVSAWKKISGIYNYSNEGTTNWAEIAQYIVKFGQYKCLITPIRSTEFPTVAPRPRYSKLNLSKFRETFGIDIRSWQNALHECLTELQTKHH